MDIQDEIQRKIAEVEAKARAQESTSNTNNTQTNTNTLPIPVHALPPKPASSASFYANTSKPTSSFSASSSPSSAFKKDSQGFTVPSSPAQERPIPEISNDLAYIMSFAGDDGGISDTAGILGAGSSEDQTVLGGIGAAVDEDRDDNEDDDSDEEDSDSESDSDDSDSQSDSNSDSDTNDPSSPIVTSTTQQQSAPMTQAQRESFLSQLTSWGPGTGIPDSSTVVDGAMFGEIIGMDEEGNEVGYITESSEEEEEDGDDEEEVDDDDDEEENEDEAEDDSMDISPPATTKDKGKSKDLSADLPSGSELTIKPELRDEDEEVEIEALFDGERRSSSGSSNERAKLSTTLASTTLATDQPKPQAKGKGKGKGKPTTRSPSSSPISGTRNLDLDEDVDGDEDGPPSTAPLRTEHEILSEPIKIPTVETLPEGTRLILAGVVMSCVLEVELWEREEKEKSEREAKEKAERGELEKVKVETEEEKADVRKDIKDERATEEGDSRPPEVAKSTEAPASIPEVAETGPAAVEERIDVVMEISPVNLTDAVPTISPLPPIPSSSSTNIPKSKPRPSHPNKKRETTKSSPGTVIIRAQRAEFGTGLGKLRQGELDGWLEEDSLICDSTGRVIAYVSETFGPTTSPFYLLRLPPSPYPLPPRESIEQGSKLYYPVDRYRSFVPIRMLQTDRRFKGTDASNIWDEEINGEEEMEFSDDEQEAEAKKRRKHGGRESRMGSVAPSHYAPSEAGGTEADFLDYGSTANQLSSLARTPDDNSSEQGQDWEMKSDSGAGVRGRAASIADTNMTTSTAWGNRAAPIPYDDIYGSSSATTGSGSSGRGKDQGGSRGGREGREGDGNRGGRGKERGRGGRGGGLDRGDRGDRGRGGSRGGRGDSSGTRGGSGGRGGSRGGRDDRGGRGGGRGGFASNRDHDRPTPPHLGGAGEGGGARERSHPYSPPQDRNNQGRNFMNSDGGRSIGRGAGRGAGGGRGRGGFGGPSSPRGDPGREAATASSTRSEGHRERGRELSPFSQAIARVEGSAGQTGIGANQQGMVGQGQRYQQQQQMGMPYGLGMGTMGMGMGGMGMGMGMPYGMTGMGYGSPQQQHQQQQQQQQQQYSPHQHQQTSAFPSYAAGSTGMSMPMHTGMAMGMGMPMGMGMNMGMMAGGYTPSQGQGQGIGMGMGAINPRFAAQFGAGMGRGMGMGMAGGGAALSGTSAGSPTGRNTASGGTGSAAGADVGGSSRFENVE